MLKKSLMDKVMDVFAERDRHHGQIQGLIQKRSSPLGPLKKANVEHRLGQRQRRRPEDQRDNISY